MSIYRGLRVSRRHIVLLRPDGTYCVQPSAQAEVPTPSAVGFGDARLGVARTALRELDQRRMRDGVARRLLREAGVIAD